MISVNIFLFLVFSTSRSVFAISDLTFREDFRFGVASSAYQIEGAWNINDKGENIWDHAIHNNHSRIKNEGTGDVACNSYENYKEDVENLANLNLSHYKFSLSWSRILPSGFNDKISLTGLLYYQNLITELEKHNITPIVTLYHWDLPQSIQDLGGWTYRNIVNYFRDYAEVVFKYLPTVKNWITVNEPKQVCVGGYGDGSKAPFINMSGQADYLCAHHVILAHAAVYHLYHNNFSEQAGKISIALDGAWYIPKTNSTDDKHAQKRKLLFDFGLYAYPLYFGDWPQLVKERIEKRSTTGKSRLPDFTDEEKKTINQTVDFLTINFYDTKMITIADDTSKSSISYDNDVMVVTSVNDSWTIANDGNSIYPEGLRYFLRYVKKTYNDPEILIGGNGIPDDGTTTDDFERLNYLADYLSSVLTAINTDKVNVIGYTMWSLMDDFEWTEGYSLHYGLYSINFTDPKRTRKPKQSVNYYKRIIIERSIPDPEIVTPTIPTTTPTITTTTSTSFTTPAGSSTTASGSKHSIELLTFIFALVLYSFEMFLKY